jgi:hypothetical protein
MWTLIDILILLIRSPTVVQNSSDDPLDLMMNIMSTLKKKKLLCTFEVLASYYTL